MFYVIEGIDQCGKGRQTQLLLDRLRKNKFNPAHLREPGGTPLSEALREIVMHKKSLEINPIAELLLYSAARAQLQGTIHALLEAQTPIVCERYFYSSLAYQGYGRGLPVEKIAMIMNGVIECIEPTHVFLLDIPVCEMYVRREAAGIEPDRLESSGASFFERVREGYLHQASANPAFHCIDGLQSMEVIHEYMWNVVEHSLPKSQ